MERMEGDLEGRGGGIHGEGRGGDGMLLLWCLREREREEKMRGLWLLLCVRKRGKDMAAISCMDACN
jgi:hypothetical protein